MYIIYFHKYINSYHIYAASSSLSPSSMLFMVSEDDEQDTDYGSSVARGKRKVYYSRYLRILLVSKFVVNIRLWIMKKNQRV